MDEKRKVQRTGPQRRRHALKIKMSKASEHNEVPIQTQKLSQMQIKKCKTEN